MFKKFIQKLKDLKLLKPLVAVIFIIIMMFTNNLYKDYTNKNMYTAENTSESDEASEETDEFHFHIGVSNIVVMAGLVIALVVVKKKDDISGNKQKEQ